MMINEDGPAQPGSAAKQAGGATEDSLSERASSFLVRVWKEPSGDGESILRGYYRNLKTGEEHYVADPHALCEILQIDQPTTGPIDLREVRAAAQERRVNELST